MMPDKLAEQTKVAVLEGVGVETFEMVGGLAELRTTIVMKWGEGAFCLKSSKFMGFHSPLSQC